LALLNDFKAEPSLKMKQHEEQMLVFWLCFLSSKLQPFASYYRVSNRTLHHTELT